MRRRVADIGRHGGVIGDGRGKVQKAGVLDGRLAERHRRPRGLRFNLKDRAGVTIGLTKIGHDEFLLRLEGRQRLGRWQIDCGHERRAAPLDASGCSEDGQDGAGAV